MRWISLCTLALLTSGCNGCNNHGALPQQAFTLDFLAPLSSFQVATGQVVTIMYEDDDPANLATSSFFADQDGDLTTTGDQIAIELNRPEGDGATQTISWDTSGVPPGNYRIFAMMTDGATTITFEAPGVVATVTGPNIAPTLALNAPDQPITLSRGGCVPVSYVDDDPDDVASTSLVADVDGDLTTTGDARDIELGRPEQDGQTQTLFWNSLGTPEGTYFIGGTTDDGINPPVTDVAAGSVTLENVAYAKRAGGDPFQSANAVSAVADGSSAVTGNYDTFFGPITFGPGEPGAVVFTAGGGAFVARYNADGAVAWARRADGGDGRSVASFADGSCVVAGFFFGSITLGPGDGDETSFASSATSDRDGFVARYDANGAMVWAVQIGDTSTDEANHVVSMTDDSCIVAGTFRGTVTFGAGEANETTLTSPAFGGAFVARYAADGSLVWARSPGVQDARGFAAFPDGSYALMAQGNEIHAYNADGSVAWMRTVANMRASAVAGFADGSLAVGGGFDAAVVFGAGEANETTLTPVGQSDTFVARYNADGTLAWARGAGGTGFVGANAISSLADGSCVVAGSLTGTATFGAGEANETMLASAPFFFVPGSPSQDMFVARYFADGTLAFARAAGGTTDDSATGVAGFPDCSCVVTGLFSDTVTFGEGDARETVLTDPLGVDAKDMFLVRYNGDGGH